MAKDPRAVEEYVDGNGNTFQLNEADAKKLGYAKVDNKVIAASDAETDAAPPAKPSRRTTTTK